MAAGDLYEFWQTMRGSYAADIVRSGVLVAVLVALRIAIGRAIGANTDWTLDDRRRWSITARNVLFITGVAGIALIWASELQTIAVSMLAFAAAVILATKELIMCLTGGLLRSASNSYGLGDHIEVAHIRGRVVDIGLLTTTVMEIGPEHDSHQMTGRALAFPHSLLLTQPVIQENYMGEYVVHTVKLTLPLSLPPARAERLLLAAAQDAVAPFLAAAQRHMSRIEAIHHLDTPSVEPRVSVQTLNDTSYLWSLRIALPAKSRQRTEQLILKHFLREAFPEPADDASAGNVQPSPSQQA